MTTACAQNVTSLSGEERRRVQTLSWLLSLSFLLPGVRLHSVVSTGWRIRLILGLLSWLHTNKGIQNSFYFSNTKMLCYKMFNKSNKDKREKRRSQYLWLIFQGFLILSSPETTPPNPLGVFYTCRPEVFQGIGGIRPRIFKLMQRPSRDILKVLVLVKSNLDI